jgi:putative tryptophan/tyrosine transport system substrate-binding protein
MRRRDFITGIVVSTATPLAARAQHPTTPVIGFLHSGSPGSFTRHMTAFRQGLSEIGYVEGQNVAIEYRWAEGQYDRLPALAADLVNRKVAVIVAGAPPAALAAKASTTAIPIVFGIGYDPVQYGLVTSLNRPGGNVTGVIFFSGALAPKRLQLLHEIVPTASAVGLLVNPNTPTSEGQVSDVRAAALALGWALHVFNVDREGDFDGVFANVNERRVAALIVGGDPMFVSSQGRIIALAARYSLPAIYDRREYTEAGGLMSYGTSLIDVFRQQGVYTGRILKGEKPADLPVTQPTTFELVINLKTAKTLGLSIPSGVLAIADEVIE